MVKFMKNNNPNIKIRVNVPNPTMMTIADLIQYRYNSKLREYTTPLIDHQYQNLFESIRDTGINQEIEVWINENGKFEVVSGHTRIRACSENGCLDIPVKILTDLEGLSANDPAVIKHWKDTNINVGITPISVFYTVEEMAQDAGAVNKDGEIIDKGYVKLLLKDTVCTVQMYKWIQKLKYGYDLKGVWVEPKDNFITDLEQGIKTTGVERMVAIQLEEHYFKHDPNAHGSPRDPEVEELLMQLDIKWLKACKETLQEALALTHPRYKTTPLANADLQYRSGTMHYIVSDFFKNEINNGDNEFTADAPNTSTPYDVYVYKNGYQVATLEVKTTKDTAFSSNKQKLGYHMLVSISKELNMWAAAVYLPPGSWSTVAGKGIHNLTIESIGENNQWMHEYCGILDKNDNKWRMIKLDINKNLVY